MSPGEETPEPRRGGRQRTRSKRVIEHDQEQKRLALLRESSRRTSNIKTQRVTKQAVEAPTPNNGNDDNEDGNGNNDDSEGNNDVPPPKQAKSKGRAPPSPVPAGRHVAKGAENSRTTTTTTSDESARVKLVVKPKRVVV
ncbi:hypothetical protein FRC07_001164 [Ceratobasidium sp. 392]|nr:hypothetical protein FRC07_001164 [Ceratobasidium sp. 392]